MTVIKSKELIAFLGGGIQGNGIVCHVRLLEWDLHRIAINAGGRGVNEVVDRILPAGFEDIVKAEDIGLDIGIGVFEAVPHAGLGGEVDDDGGEG